MGLVLVSVVYFSSASLHCGGVLSSGLSFILQCITSSSADSDRESVLFIGTQFSNLYTAVDTPARGRVVRSWLSSADSDRERALFVGTQFSSLYTAVDTPAVALQTIE